MGPLQFCLPVFLGIHRNPKDQLDKHLDWAWDKFWQFFRMGRDDRAMLVRPSRIPHRNFKNLFVLSSYESLERLKAKIGDAPFSKVQCGKITVCFILFHFFTIFILFSDTTSTNIAEEKNTFALSVLRR